MSNDEKSWLAADYVLGLMPGAERQTFGQQLQTDPQLAKLVLAWQERLSWIDARAHSLLCPGMAQNEVDAALGSVFDRVFRVINRQADASPSFDNPLARLTREQLTNLRPIVVRLIASYLVLLERLKAQQLRMADFPGAI